MIERRRREQKDPELRERFKGTNRFSGIGDNSSLYKSMKSSEKALDRIRTQKEQAREIEDMGKRLDKLYELEQKEAHYMRLFNKRINEWKKATKQD
jgi:replicative superfamily II helicase